MEKTVVIDGKNVVFRKSGATMLAYKRQTGHEFYADLSAFLDMVERDESGKIIMIDGVPKVDMTKFDIEYMYQMLYVMARAADKTIPADLLQWLDTFEDFNVISIFVQLLPMLADEMTVDPKN